MELPIRFASTYTSFCLSSPAYTDTSQYRMFKVAYTVFRETLYQLTEQEGVS